MNLKLLLTDQQIQELDPLWKQAIGGGCGHVLTGQILRYLHPHPQAGALYIDLHLVKRPVAEAMRAAFVKATQPAPPKTRKKATGDTEPVPSTERPTAGTQEAGKGHLELHHFTQPQLEPA